MTNINPLQDLLDNKPELFKEFRKPENLYSLLDKEAKQRIICGEVLLQKVKKTPKNNGDLIYSIELNGVEVPHRIDGPAITTDDGTEFWFFAGEPHRIDGPAVTGPNVDDIYYMYGEVVSKGVIDAFLSERSKAAGNYLAEKYAKEAVSSLKTSTEQTQAMKKKLGLFSARNTRVFV